MSVETSIRRVWLSKILFEPLIISKIRMINEKSFEETKKRKYNKGNKAIII
jgi:hypothetical protein